MEAEGNFVFLSSSILIAVFFGGAVLVLMYILKVMRLEKPQAADDEKNVKDFEQFDARKDTTAAAAGSHKKKKNTDNRWTNRTDKQGFTHPWLFTSLKGHTGQVLDMDFASNGKYLASCADEEPDPGDDLVANADTGGTSSGSECNKENSRPSSADQSPRVAKPLSRRQRKNRRREDSSSPETKKKSKAKKVSSPVAIIPITSVSNSSEKKANDGASNKKSEFPSYVKLGLKDGELYRFLRSYLLSPEQMLTLGYPVEYASHPGRAVIFKSAIPVPSYPKSAYKYNKPESKSGFDVNAREFIPNIYRKAAAMAIGENSSGHDSGNSSDSGGKIATKSNVAASLKEDLSKIPEFILCREATDRTVVLWDIKDLHQKDRKSLRLNVEFDHPTMVKWSPDSKAFIISKYSENTIEVYKIEKKKDSWIGHPSKAFTFPKVHVEDIIAFDIACNGKYIMTCSNKTDLIIWDLKGQELAKVDTYLMTTFCAKISPCGKFIVASGFAPDVKVWEVIFSKTGDFQEVKRVFELSGHTSGVYDVAFDADTSHIATISKDGTWKLFDTKIDYKKGEDPHLLTTGKYEQGSSPSLIALSPNAEVVVAATTNSLAFYSALSGNLDYKIENIYNGKITSVLFDSLGKYIFITGDKHIRVFHNVTGYRCAITTAKEKLKQNQTSATKERLQKLIADSESFLHTIDTKA